MNADIGKTIKIGTHALIYRQHDLRTKAMSHEIPGRPWESLYYRLTHQIPCHKVGGRVQCCR